MERFFYIDLYFLRGQIEKSVYDGNTRKDLNFMTFVVNKAFLT